MRLKHITTYFATVVIRNGYIVNANDNHPLCDESSNHRCDDGYQCRKGKKDYTSWGFAGPPPWVDTDKLDQQHEYCDCRERDIGPGKFGMTGQGCDVIFKKCPDATVCLNGASCEMGSGSNYFCDCSTAFYPSGKLFVGENCEFEAQECEFNPGLEKYDVTIDGKWMCANGNCQDGAVSPASMCNCKAGFDGHHCEFPGTAPKCELDCYNDGICKIGIKNFDYLSPTLREYFQLQYEGHDAHCICPEGFTGTKCEISISNCGDITCLNDSECIIAIDEDGVKRYHCDCEKAPGPQMYAGDSCESVSSSICHIPVGFDSSEFDDSSIFFCTNQGICPANNWDACTCPVDYTGPKCEFLVQHHKECSMQCENGGTCFHVNNHLFLNSMECKCPDEFPGPLCAGKKETSVTSPVLLTFAHLIMGIHVFFFAVGLLLLSVYILVSYGFKPHDHDPVENITAEDEILHHTHTIT